MRGGPKATGPHHRARNVRLDQIPWPREIICVAHDREDGVLLVHSACVRFSRRFGRVDRESRTACPMHTPRGTQRVSSVSPTASSGMQPECAASKTWRPFFGTLRVGVLGASVAGENPLDTRDGDGWTEMNLQSVRTGRGAAVHQNGLKHKIQPAPCEARSQPNRLQPRARQQFRFR